MGLVVLEVFDGVGVVSVGGVSGVGGDINPNINITNTRSISNTTTSTTTKTTNNNIPPLVHCGG